jgi:shikimate dehydrogenase
VRIYGLIGKPLEHSWSQSYFEEKFREEHITGCCFVNYPLDDISDIRRLVNTNQGISGLNVTIPYKTGVIRFLDYIDFNAEQIGAVNCIKIIRKGDGTVLEGFNTDYLAFFRTILPLIPAGIGKAIVLGTGGAAKAVCHALKMAGIDITIVSREKQEGRLIYTDLNEQLVQEHLLIINATPVGTYGYPEAPLPLPYDAVGRQHILYDLVYNPPETAFLTRAKEAGATAINGLEMLKAQADLSWKIWNS